MAVAASDWEDGGTEWEDRWLQLQLKRKMEVVWYPSVLSTHPIAAHHSSSKLGGC